MFSPFCVAVFFARDVCLFFSTASARLQHQNIVSTRIGLAFAVVESIHCVHNIGMQTFLHLFILFFILLFIIIIIIIIIL